MRIGEHAKRGLENLIGKEHCDCLCDLSTPTPLPVAGTPFYVVDGLVIPKLAGAGFTSLSDLISEATTGGKLQKMSFMHIGTNAVASQVQSQWKMTGMPGVGATPAALPGGDVPTRATVGALGQADPGGGDTLHVTTLEAASNTPQRTLILYDRLWHGTIAMNSTAAQSVTGVPTRYLTTESKGNVMWPEVRTVLPATAHNHTFTYVDQDGNTAEAAALFAGIASAAVGRLDLPLGQWYVALNAGDTGVRNITQYQCSALVASGNIDLVVARPLAMLPLPLAGSSSVVDGINSCFNLAEVKTGACLAFLDFMGTAATANIQGMLALVSG